MQRALLYLATLAALLAGCTADPGAQPVAVEHAELGRQFLLADEPEGAVGIIDYRESLPADAEPVETDVVLLGKIGGGRRGRASRRRSWFAIRRKLAADHVCDSDNCPFCKAKQGEDKSHAIVMLTGSDNRVPAHDARKLLPLAEGQMVVVRGRAEINAAGQLVVHARGLYVRR